MATAKKKKNSTAPSPAQIRARKKFAKMAKDRAKAARLAKRTQGKGTAKRPAKKGNAKAKRATSAKPVVRKNGKKLYGAAAQAVLNSRNKGKKKTPAKKRNMSHPSGGKLAAYSRKSKGRGRNVQGFEDATGFHPIRGSSGYSGQRAGEYGSKIAAVHAARVGSGKPARKGIYARNPVRRVRVNGHGCLAVPVRRNPGTGQLYNDFQGRPSKENLALPVPNSAAKDLYVLGALSTLQTARNTYNFEVAEAALVADKQGNLVIATETTLQPNKDLGDLQKVSYVTTKSHINPGQNCEYVHKLGEEGGAKPRLMTDEEGMLIIRGGDYYITPDGIAN